MCACVYCRDTDGAVLLFEPRPGLSAYERGRKSPALATVQRLLAAAGFRLVALPKPDFSIVKLRRGRTIVVPDALPTLPAFRALRKVVLPIHLNWSDPSRVFNLAIRRERARVYEIVLREGGQDDITELVDGALLVDLWNELVLPTEVRSAWSPIIARFIS